MSNWMLKRLSEERAAGAWDALEGVLGNSRDKGLGAKQRLASPD